MIKATHNGQLCTSIQDPFARAIANGIVDKITKRISAILNSNTDCNVFIDVQGSFPNFIPIMTFENTSTELQNEILSAAKGQ